MILRAAISSALCLILVACGEGGSFGSLGSFGSASLGSGGADRRAERALPFRARLSAGEDKRDFTVSVQNHGTGVAEVRESVRFHATRHCLYNFGGSDADWVTDPATGDWAFQQSGEDLIFSGRCTRR